MGGAVDQTIVDKTRLYVQHSPASLQRYWIKSQSVFPAAVAVVIASAGDQIDLSKFNLPDESPFTSPYSFRVFPLVGRHGGEVPAAWIVPPVRTQIARLLPICVAVSHTLSLSVVV